MFIDTSVIIAILSQEDDAREFAEIIEAAPDRYTSALVLLEAAMRLSTKLNVDPVIVEERLRYFVVEAQIEIAPMDERTASLAIKAFADYGKGRGHPAQLNLADCLSYACAKSLGTRLLYKGRDFAKTDLA